MTVSIIIAVKTWQKNLEECVANCLKLDYPDFEIIILPDDATGTVPAIANTYLSKGTVPNLRIIPTGPIGPAHKRDIGTKHAEGDILAFIDDDAYPCVNWLKYAAENFRDDRVAAVGGPAVTPEADSLSQKASGRIYSSFLVSAHFTYRYLPGRRQEVQDYPSCNLLVRADVMRQLGGFDSNFWPGEDTKLCLDITHKLGKKIIYDPRVLVYHHRRRLFMPHLRQISSYALHRGYFAKHYPATSLKLSFFVPSIFLVLFILGAALSFLIPVFKVIYLSGLALYLSLVFIFSISKELRLIPLVFSGIILSHLCYGYYFLKGLFSKGLTQ